MFCSNCGNTNFNGTNVCPVCGTVVGAQAPVQNQSAGQPVNQFNQPGNQFNQPAGQPVNQFNQPARPVNQYQAQPQYGQYGMGTAPNFVVNNFANEAKNLKIMGIFAAVLMFGIGFIFSIIILVKAGKLNAPDVMGLAPQEVAQVEKGKSDIKTAKILAMLPFAALALSFLSGIILGIAGVA